MSNDSTQFNNAWIGYDLPFEKVESQPDVDRLRKEGIEKRVKTAEYHVTVGWFEKAALDELAKVVSAAEEAIGKKLYQTIFDFNGMGRSEGPDGTYAYFTPNPESASEAFFLKQFFTKSPVYDSAKNCQDLHLSIGGADPFTKEKPKTEELTSPFSARGNLVFVGNDGKKFRRYEWHSMRKEFREIELAPPLGMKLEELKKVPKKESGSQGIKGAESQRIKGQGTRDVEMRESKGQTAMEPWQTPIPVSQIAIFPKIQADTAAAIYLLKAFGGQAFPGIESAPIVFWTQAPNDKTPEEHLAAGTLLIDLGGTFDHHLVNERLGKRQECVSTLLATYLKIEQHPALKKLLTWAKRDDLEGKGTISADALDRAFGLSGIIMNLNREYNESPQLVLDLVLPIIDAHVQEEIRRTILMPKEWQDLLASGQAELFTLQQGTADLQVAVIESDNVALPGFVRAAKNVDLIVQRRSEGHTNIITKQLRSIDLRPIIEALRLAEAEKKGVTLTESKDALQSPGRIEHIDEWFYDDAGNTLQNGGVSPEGVTPTRLSKDEVVAVVKDAIPHGKIGHIKRERAKGR